MCPEQANLTGPHLLVQREAVVASCGQSDQVPLLHEDANPPVLVISHLKVPAALQHVADLFVRVQMFLIKRFELEQGGKSESAGDQGRARPSKTRAEVDANHPPQKEEAA